MGYLGNPEIPKPYIAQQIDADPELKLISEQNPTSERTVAPDAGAFKLLFRLNLLSERDSTAPVEYIDKTNVGDHPRILNSDRVIFFFQLLGSHSTIGFTCGQEPGTSALVSSFSLLQRGARQEEKEMQTNMKRLILAGCSIMVLSAGTALAGPCDTTGRTAILKDAGSGPASQGNSQTTGVGSDVNQHPPTSSMNRASGDLATSSQDAAADARPADCGATDRRCKQGGRLTAQETQRQMHAQPSVAEQPKGTSGLSDDKGC